MCKINEDMVNEAKRRYSIEIAATMILDELLLDKVAKHSRKKLCLFYFAI